MTRYDFGRADSVLTSMGLRIVHKQQHGPSAPSLKKAKVEEGSSATSPTAPATASGAAVTDGGGSTGPQPEAASGPLPSSGAEIDKSDLRNIYVETPLRPEEKKVWIVQSVIYNPSR